MYQHVDNDPRDRNLVLLATYPKSLNTWMRIAFILYTDILNGANPEAADIKNLGARTQSFTDARQIEIETGRSIHELTPRQIAQSSLRLQGKVNAAISDIHRKMSGDPALTPPMLLVKTHAAYLNDAGVPTFDLRNVRAIIHVVRDPVGIALSYAYHTFGSGQLWELKDAYIKNKNQIIKVTDQYIHNPDMEYLVDLLEKIKLVSEFTMRAGENGIVEGDDVQYFSMISDVISLLSLIPSIKKYAVLRQGIQLFIESNKIYYTAMRDDPIMLKNKADKQARGEMLTIDDDPVSLRMYRNIDHTIRFMNDARASTAPAILDVSLGEFCSSWKRHTESWANPQLRPLVRTWRYEDMTENNDTMTAGFMEMLEHVGMEVNEAVARRVVEMTTLDKLEEAEKKTGFSERLSPTNFFKPDGKDEWKNHLSPYQVDKIVRGAYEQMLRFGYVPMHDVNGKPLYNEKVMKRYRKRWARIVMPNERAYYDPLRQKKYFLPE